MVNLVIVSHSARIAAGVRELVEQVAPRELKVFAAGGLDPETLGTNVETILNCLNQADNPDGTLVLVDLGSAILSTEAAVELLEAEAQGRVRICAAALVEGAVAAGVQAGLGADLETVCREALGALAPKIEQLPFGQEKPEPTAAILPAPAEPEPLEPPGPALSVTLRLENPHGLHVRPAARFVRLAASFDADVSVENQSGGKGPFSARSLNRLAWLGARRGDTICIRAAGPQASIALAALTGLVQDGFGEREPDESEPSLELLGSRTAGIWNERLQEGSAQAVPGAEPLLPGGEIQAVPVSPGFAIAPLALYKPARPAIDNYPATNPQNEWQRLQMALDRVGEAIQRRRERLAARLGSQQAEIFDAHLLILSDPELLDPVRRSILESGESAAHAWERVIQEAAGRYANLEDPYQRQRTADVREVGEQVLIALLGESLEPAPLESDGPVVLVAWELAPGQVAQLDLERVRGLVTVQGGPTSHAGILARALGLPAVAGVPAALLELTPGGEVALDGDQGLVWLKPGPPVRARIARARRLWLEQRRRLDEAAQAPGATADGVRIEVAANVASLPEALAARRSGAEGVGVLRTEFLFLDRRSVPSEDEQIALLRPICAALEGRPLIVRLLDAGGDKPLPYLDQAAEANPFLGVRGIRLLRARPELLSVQLRAILRLGLEYPLRIMAPMVASLDEVRFLRQSVEAAHIRLEAENLPHGWPIPLGIMVETPAAALLAPLLAQEVDFLSVGTNDLTQYTLAAERGNPALAGFADALHPAVLRLIQAVVQGAQGRACWVGVCGEIAGDPAATAILVGLGVSELSMGPAAIPLVKDALRNLRVDQARRLAEMALQAEDAFQVRRLGDQIPR